METMNIALPESLKDFVQTQVAEGGYSSASEYVRELIRKDVGAKKAVLESRLLAALDSGTTTEMTDRDWEALRNRVRAGSRPPSRKRRTVKKRK
jgi:antitoxin ParD1/3/4